MAVRFMSVVRVIVLMGYSLYYAAPERCGCKDKHFRNKKWKVKSEK